jgi:hypothetical protein
MHRERAVLVCLRVASAGGAENIILSAGVAETIILSAGGAESMMLSACAESMIVLVPPTESMILSVPFDCVITLTGNVGGNGKTTISDTGDHRLTILVDSASTVVPIGLLPKMAEFCHTSNRLLVGCRCGRALWRLYFNSSVCSQLVGSLVGKSVWNLK